MRELLEERIINFSRLSDEECASLLRDSLLEALESEAYIDWEIVTKFILTSYAERERLCKLFNSSVKRNKQKIGNFTIGEWIKRYQDKYSNKERMPNTFFEYVSNDPDVKKLSKHDQSMLARILRIYDYLLIIPITDLDGPVIGILRFAMRSETAPLDNLQGNGQDRSTSTQDQSSVLTLSVQMTLQEALKKYERLGEQSLSGNPIKLKILDTPVRPSIKNWISDYYEKTEAKRHDSIERGNYLFHSENARRLTTGERQKVGTILRALDEDSLILVDQAKQEVVFQGEAMASGPIPKANQAGNQSGMSFSSPHQFPSELSRANQSSVSPRQNFRPSSNVVDLKNV